MVAVDRPWLLETLSRSFNVKSSGMCSNPSFNADQVFIVNVLLAVRQLREQLVCPLELRLRKFIAQLAVTVCERMPAGVFPENDMVGWHADRFRRHDLVSDGVLQNPVLMDAGLVSKCVPADNGFVSLHLHSR